MIRLNKSGKPPLGINFMVNPRDFFQDSVYLPIETIKALNTSAVSLKNASNGRYEIILTRGYINWSLWRQIRGAVAKVFFCFLYNANKSDADLLFNSNGHDDGLSIDIQIHDVHLKRTIKFLSWKNVFIRRSFAEDIIKSNINFINLVQSSMNFAGFIEHEDPREQLQMHYRLAI